MVTVREAFLALRLALKTAGIPDAAFDAAQLLLFAGAPDYRVQPDALLNDAAQQKLDESVRRRCARQPLQYIVGQWDFLDFTLEVGSGVLIPRADTEIVAETAIEAGKAAGAQPCVVDLCSGTGAIALAVALHVPGAQVTAVELSQQALFYLNKNNATYHVPLQVVSADVFYWQNSLSPDGIDVLVSNPPYVTTQEMAALAPELLFEPRMALEAPDEGLAFYKHIAPAYYPALRPEGTLIFEIGASQADAVKEICGKAGYIDVAMKRDLAGNPRVITAKKPAEKTKK